MRRRTAGFTGIELVVALAGVGVLLASGLAVALWGTPLLYIAAMIFPPLGLFLSGRRLSAVLVLLLSGALWAGVAGFLLIPAGWAEEPALSFRNILMGSLGVFAFAYPFLVLWAWDSVRQAWESRGGMVAAGDDAATAGSRPRGGLLSRPVVVYPTILVLSYVALTVGIDVLLRSADGGRTALRSAGAERERSVWSFRIGDYNLAGLKLTQDANGITVRAEGFDLVEYPKILTQPDADRQALVREALTTLLERNDLRGVPVCVVVSDDVARTAVIETGPSPGNARSTAEAEARQMVGPPAVSDDRLIMGYQAQPARAGVRGAGRVAVCAAERDALRGAVAPFLTASVEIADVQANGFALVNYLRREILPTAGAPGLVMLIEMNSETTNVLIADGDDYWHDQIAIGANHFTRSLSEGFHLTFAKAEHLKRNATKAPDPRSVFTSMRGVYNDCAHKVQASVDRWASKHPGMTIRSVYGIGQGFKLPGLTKFLSQNLVPPGAAEAAAGPAPKAWQVNTVAKFVSLPGEDVVSAPQFQENVTDFAALYGSGVQWLGLTDLKTSLAWPPQTWSERWGRASHARLAPLWDAKFNPVALYLALACVETVWLIGRIRRSRRPGLVAPGQDTTAGLRDWVAARFQAKPQKRPRPIVPAIVASLLVVFLLGYAILPDFFRRSRQENTGPPKTGESIEPATNQPGPAKGTLPPGPAKGTSPPPAKPADLTTSVGEIQLKRPDTMPGIVREFTDENWRSEVLDSPIPVVVHFWAPWSGPSRKLAPTIEKLAGDYEGKVKVGKMNTDENPETPGSLRISVIPIVLVFHQGKEVDRLVGVNPETKFKASLDKLVTQAAPR
jgi:thioredoxin